VILGYPKVGPAIDLWSLACIVFELITGDFLFDPKAEKTLDKDVYHLVLFMQVLGCAPRTLPTPRPPPPAEGEPWDLPLHICEQRASFWSIWAVK